jgi:hypothetical protein
MMAIYKTYRPLPTGHADIPAAVRKLDNQQHPLHNIPLRQVPIKNVSPLGPTRAVKK